MIKLMATRLPDELYIEIFKLTGENPMLFRVCKHFQHIIFDLYPFNDGDGGKMAVKVCKMIIWFNRIDLLKIFKYIRDFPDLNFFPIEYAVSFGQVRVVTVLLSNKRADPSINDNYAIRIASHSGQHEIVRLLLTHPKVDPSAGYNYAIRVASENGHTEVVKVLSEDPRVRKTIGVLQFLKK